MIIIIIIIVQGVWWEDDNVIYYYYYCVQGVWWEDDNVLCNIIIIIVYREFGEKMTMYWRILKDDGEIEMILKVSEYVCRLYML